LKKLLIKMVVVIDDGKGATVKSIHVENLAERGERVKVKEIRLSLAGQNVTVPDFEAADKALRNMAQVKSEQGNERVTFSLTFDDGEIFTGTYELMRDDIRKLDILAKHVREFVRFHAGLDTGRFTTNVDEYFKTANVNPEQFRYFYERYELGQEPK
jgi:hypothetical protein